MALCEECEVEDDSVSRYLSCDFLNLDFDDGGAPKCSLRISAPSTMASLQTDDRRIIELHHLALGL